MTSKSLYDILELDIAATATDIKQHYRKLALAWHPDKNTDNPIATENFLKISKAYKILSDPQQKHEYDIGGRASFSEDALPDDSFAAPEDAFKNFFDNLADSGLFTFDEESLEHLFAGPEMKIAFTTFGHAPKSAELLQHLSRVTSGSKVEPLIDQVNKAFDDSQNRCITKSKSPDIHVSLWVDLEDIYHKTIKKVKLNIVNYLVEKDTHVKEQYTFLVPSWDKQVVFEAQADFLKDCGRRGDIIIDTTVRRHPLFRRKHWHDLIFTKYIGVAEVLLGTTFYVKHLSGRMLKIASPGLCDNKHSSLIQQDPAIYQISEGLGLPISRFSESYGNLFVEFSIKAELSEKQRCELQTIIPPISTESNIIYRHSGEYTKAHLYEHVRDSSNDHKEN